MGSQGGYGPFTGSWMAYLPAERCCELVQAKIGRGTPPRQIALPQCSPRFGHAVIGEVRGGVMGTAAGSGEPHFDLHGRGGVGLQSGRLGGSPKPWARRASAAQGTGALVRC